MTVGELIQALQTFPDDLEVVVIDDAFDAREPRPDLDWVSAHVLGDRQHMAFPSERGARRVVRI